MKDDPAIQAVRDARHRISESVQHDPRKLVEYYRERQKRHRDRLILQEAKPPKKDESAAPLTKAPTADDLAGIPVTIEDAASRKPT
jgi:hypothetical protein